MAEILLSSEKFIKEVTSISDNVASKYILPSLREAQETGLKSILGEVLLNKLKSLYKAGTLSGIYKTIVDESQYYLAYATLVEVANRVSYKLGNFGVTKSTDTNIQVATQDEIAKMQDYYQSKADARCVELQNYLLDHRANIPELTESHCHKIESNLYSAASCGIWLGGARGKGSARKCRR